MQEIRFSSGGHQAENDTHQNNNKPTKSNPFLILFGYILKVILIVIALYGIFVGYRYLMAKYNSPEDNGYSAVFLVNSQVYFGKIIKNSKSEMVLNDVFYLQVNEQGESADATNPKGFTLVKLGQELHGPKDELFINKDQIVFYEFLREDSKIVESIKSQK